MSPTFAQRLMLFWLFAFSVGCYSAKSTETTSGKKDAVDSATTQQRTAMDSNTVPPISIDKSADRSIDEGVDKNNASGSSGDRPVDSSTYKPRIPLNHRPVAETCDNIREVPEPYSGQGIYFYAAECNVHADCNQGINGRCVVNRDTGFCTYDGCFEDSDCGENVCLCGSDEGSANSCMMGNCQVDDDCGPNGYCSPSYGSCGAYSGIVAYYCHTPEDECIDYEDCGGVEGQWGPYCAFNVVAGKWMCGDSHCVG